MDNYVGSNNKPTFEGQNKLMQKMIKNISETNTSDLRSMY